MAKLTVEMVQEYREQIAAAQAAYAETKDIVQRNIAYNLTKRLKDAGVSVVIGDPIELAPETPISSRGFVSAGRTFEYGKLYTYKSYSFSVWNPDRLSDKQRKVVNSFVKEMNLDGAHVNLTFELAAPWIDVIFMFNRGQMTEDIFNKITGLGIQTSVFNRHNDHNL